MLVPFILLVWILVFTIVKLSRHIVITVYFIFRYRLLDLVLLSQRQELFRILCSESFHKFIIRNLLEAKAEVSSKEDAIDEIVFKCH